MPDYLSSWDVKSLAGEPIAVVRVRNLHHVIQGPHDAWGRPGKSQPVLISAELSFRRPFGSVAADDKLGSGTVHYGSLSKAILRVLDRFGSPPASSDGDGGASTLRDVLDALWLSLTGFAYPGSEDRTETQATPQPFLDLSVLRYLSVTVTLPKASLLGQSVSLSASSTFGLRDGFHALQGYSTTLQLRDLRVPVLIGVNPNERLAKQVVGVDVEIDKCYPYEDTYTNLERIVVKVRELRYASPPSPPSLVFLTVPFISHYLF